jgi:hypothetical protein
MLRISIATVVALLAAPAGDGGKIKWSTDGEKALEEASASGLPIMMYFTQDG